MIYIAAEPKEVSATLTAAVYLITSPQLLIRFFGILYYRFNLWSYFKFRLLGKSIKSCFIKSIY